MREKSKRTLIFLFLDSLEMTRARGKQQVGLLMFLSKVTMQIGPSRKVKDRLFSYKQSQYS